MEYPTVSMRERTRPLHKSDRSKTRVQGIKIKQQGGGFSRRKYCRMDPQRNAGLAMPLSAKAIDVEAKVIDRQQVLVRQSEAELFAMGTPMKTINAMRGNIIATARQQAIQECSRLGRLPRHMVKEVVLARAV